MSVAIIIPARLASTRLLNKPLVDILGQTMIARVYKKAIQVNNAKVFVACDSNEVKQEIENLGGFAILTDSNLPSGTDRIYAALQEIDENFDIIVNLQGDLPNIDPKTIEAAISAIKESDADIATVANIIDDEEEINDPNNVKVAISFKDQQKTSGIALYFSRSVIPYSKNDDQTYYHHIGIYAYKRKALERFVNLQPSQLEKRESLEQLRAMENDMKIAVKVVSDSPISVDTKRDLENVTLEISSQK